jgi:hypothetical protein
MYYYIQTDENGFIFSHFESTKEKAPEQTELIEVDTYDTSYAGRYYLNGEIGPAPREGYSWTWDVETSQPVETPIPTE